MQSSIEGLGIPKRYGQRFERVDFRGGSTMASRIESNDKQSRGNAPNNPLVRNKFPRNSKSSLTNAGKVHRARASNPETFDRLIEREILPRLLVAHSVDHAVVQAKSAQSESTSVSQEEARRFAPLILETEAHELLVEIESMIARGVRVDSIFIDLLAPVARKLGEFWEEDACDFVDVTMGLWRLQEIMREIAVRHPAHSARRGQARSALFAQMPGDQHSFGTLMLEELFARAGWDSEALPETQRPGLLQICSENSFDLVGLTLSTDCNSGDVTNLVTAIRSVSQYPQVKVMIGGRAVQADPSLVEKTGADGTAATADAALALADRLVPSPAKVG